MSTYHRDAWGDLIAGLLDKRGKQLANGGVPVLVQCEPGAREILRQFHNESIGLRNGEFRDIEGQLGRWRENACRIGLGLCIADDPAASVLTEQQAARAVKLARWAQCSALQVMHTGRMERRTIRANKLRDLAVAYGGEATFRNLEKSHGFRPEEVERLAREFPEVLRLETKQNPKGGPSSRVLKAARADFR